MNTRLKYLRNEKGFTQSYVANNINLSIRQYQRIENKDCKPSYDVILQLQNLFNESIDKLLDTI
jgi:transcriptional regulator with XRE-family HTH domain